nr:hypothetical protein [Tanacetum cinerariifolium]
MKMEHYLSYTDYPIWKVIQNGNGPVYVTTDTNGMIKVLTLKTAEEMWEAIKSRFGGNDESKKMQKYLLKQEFEGFSMSASEGLHKGYDSTNDVSIAYSISSPSVSKSHKEGSLSCTDEVIHYDDLKQINDDDLEEMDLKWQVAMISMRNKKAKGNQDSKRRDIGYNGNKARDNGRRHAYQDDSKALVTINGEDIDWSGHVEEDNQNYAMMAYSSSNSGFDNEE